jgi:regulator of sigma E protease
MSSILHTGFYFLLALGVLISFHELGHFLAARRLGVKVLCFSIGFGKSLWKYRSSPDETEFVVGAIPLGGYVRMVDEREGEVSESDKPFAFNRQAVWKRLIIVAAGPVFNFILAILLFWAVLLIGETGMRAVIGEVPRDTLAEQAGFLEGDEILEVEGQSTPIWSLAMGSLIEHAMDRSEVRVQVRSADQSEKERIMRIPRELVERPEALREKLGLQAWQPVLQPIVEKVESGSAAQQAGLQSGDHLLSVDGVAIRQWKQWVEYVRARPDQELHLQLERQGVQLEVLIRPRTMPNSDGKSGRIGASVRVPEDAYEGMMVLYRLGPLDALLGATVKSSDYALLTFRMMGHMLTGEASVENLSGPISIAQFAGQSARMGLTQFLKFLAVVSISLAVLNLLPIPVLDGGHLLFFLIEAAKGSPVSDEIQSLCQQAGIFVLLSLMSVAIYLDFQRLLAG